MKIKRLILDNFGPYSSYEIEFPSDNRAFVLITGKNNAGKTSILRALRLVDGALKLANGSNHSIERTIHNIYIKDLNLRSLIHGFEDGFANVTAILDTDREIKIEIDSEQGVVNCSLPPRTPESLKTLLGFMPPLGQIVSEETRLTRDNILRYINTPISPHHFRNQIYHLFDEPQKELLKKIIHDTWNNVILGDVKYDLSTNCLYCAYTEGTTTGEISFSGQGFQIWLQIIANLIRLSYCSIIILDEPEIFLHPEKQHSMVHIFREYFGGSMIIATHSSELMNEVDFSHIIYIQRKTNTTKYVSTQNRDLLEEVRQQIGSSFNLVASQFEDVERLIFSENLQDYEILNQIATRIGIDVRTHNIPIFGLNKWLDCIQYKKAHKMFFGKDAQFSLLLDKDFYPKEYLDFIDKELSINGIRTVFTPGNEIENIFLDQEFLLSVLPIALKADFLIYLNNIYNDLHEPTLIKYVESQKKYSSKDKGREFFTLYEELKPSFDTRWNDISKRHLLPDGKQILAKIRQFAKEKANMNLTTSFLIQKLVNTQNSDALELINKIYEIPIKQHK